MQGKRAELKRRKERMALEQERTVVERYLRTRHGQVVADNYAEGCLIDWEAREIADELGVSVRAFGLEIDRATFGEDVYA